MAVSLAESVLLAFFAVGQGTMALTLRSALAALTMLVTALIATLAVAGILAVETALIGAALSVVALTLALVLAWEVL